VRRHNGGFTLLEVLVALAIAATGITAMVQAMTARINRAQDLEQKVLATWVAGNRLSELRLARAWPGEGVTGGSEMAGDRALWIRQRILNTPDPDVRKVEITIFADDAEEDEAAFIFGYLLKPPGESS
jgi:general secretion pathway protein I